MKSANSKIAEKIVHMHKLFVNMVFCMAQKYINVVSPKCKPRYIKNKYQ